MDSQTKETPYIFATGEQVTFYDVDPKTKRGTQPRPGRVVEDRGCMRIKVRDDASDEVFSIKPGQAWNEDRLAHESHQHEHANAR